MTRNFSDNCNCQVGYFEIPSEKKSLCTKCPYNCFDCVNEKKCFSCIGEFRVVKDNCTCLKEYYDSLYENHTCKFCKKEC